AAVSATLNEAGHEALLLAPGAWASGGLPSAAPGQPYGDSIRSFAASASPLSAHAGALDIEVTVATAAGDKTVSVSISAEERADNPDAAPGVWNTLFQERLEAALNAAGVYLSAPGGGLMHWSIAESSGQRLVSVTVNGDAIALQGEAPAFGLGGAHGAVRSFTGASAAASVSDDVADLIADQTVSITFSTAWGERTVSATLELGDPRTLESAALRLNEALAAQGYDLGVVATALSGAGAGLRAVTGASNTVRGVSEIALGGTAYATTLDAIDSI